MDRKSVILLGMAGVLLVGAQAFGDIDYPESRFGSPPNFGAPPNESNPQIVNRSPAGLESSPNSNPLAPVKSGVQQQVALIASDLGFFPKTLFVTRNIPVKLFVTGTSKKPLCIMMDFFEVRRQVRAQKIEEIDFTPSVPGHYRFYCPINGMEGTLLVKEVTSVVNTVAPPALTETQKDR